MFYPEVAVSEDVQTVLMEPNLWWNGILKTHPWKALERCPYRRIYEGTNEINRMLSVGMLIKSNERSC
jgi:alkylation response protein AidB-like acyl-CoA dehydrogenase